MQKLDFAHGFLVSSVLMNVMHSYATSNDGTTWRCSRCLHEPHDSPPKLDSTGPGRPARRTSVHAPHNYGSRLYCECFQNEKSDVLLDFDYVVVVETTRQ